MARKRKVTNTEYAQNRDVGKKSKQVGEVGSSSKRKKSPTVRGGPAVFNAMVQCLTIQQKNWVYEVGFGELLVVPISRYDRRFLMWLLERYDPECNELQLRHDQTIRLTDGIVGWILGIPAKQGAHPPPAKGSKEQFDALVAEYGSTKDIRSDVVLQKIKQATVKEQFVRHFLLFTLGLLLCPHQCIQISPKHLYAVSNVAEVSTYNWGNYVLDWLNSSVKMYKQSIVNRGTASGMGGCLMVLALLYLDHIDIGRPVKWDFSPRITAWNNDAIHSAIKRDTGADGSYGHGRVWNIQYGKPHPVQLQCEDWEVVRVERLKMLHNELEREGKTASSEKNNISQNFDEHFQTAGLNDNSDSRPERNSNNLAGDNFGKASKKFVEEGFTYLGETNDMYHGYQENVPTEPSDQRADGFPGHKQQTNPLHGQNEELVDTLDIGNRTASLSHDLTHDSPSPNVSTIAYYTRRHVSSRPHRQTRQSAFTASPFVTVASSTLKLSHGPVDQRLLKWVRKTTRNDESAAFVMGSCFLKRTEIKSLLNVRSKVSSQVVHELAKFYTASGFKHTPPCRRYVLSPHLMIKLLSKSLSASLSDQDVREINSFVHELVAMKELTGFDIKASSLVFIPVLYNNHWTAFCFSLRDQTIFEINSLSDGSDIHNMLPRLKSILQRLFIEYDASWCVDCSGWKFKDAGMIRQDDINSCGIYMLIGIEYWNGRWISNFPSQTTSSQMREHIVLQILNHSLNELKDSILRSSLHCK